MKPKKKIRFFVYVVALLALCLSGNPLYSSASTISPNTVEVNEIQPSSRVSVYIEVKAIYDGKLDIPPSIYYNHNGYRGTLLYLRPAPNSTNGHIYGGYVYCEGVCRAQSLKEEY